MGREYFEGLGIYGGIILKWNLNKYNVMQRLDSCGSVYEQKVSPCEYKNEPFHSRRG
jgi:hypothetical protein